VSTAVLAPAGQGGRVAETLARRISTARTLYVEAQDDYMRECRTEERAHILRERWKRHILRYHTLLEVTGRVQEVNWDKEAICL